MKKSDYIPILKAIWSERNRTLRLKWLQSHAAEFHAPLMYEQAISEFVVNPTAATLFQKTLPLIRAATFRVYQDSQCCKDSSVCKGDAPLRMESTYRISLNRQIEKRYKQSLETFVMNHMGLIQENNQLCKEIAQKTLASPRLDRIFWHQCYNYRQKYFHASII